MGYQIGASKLVLRPNVVPASGIVKIHLNQFIFFIFLEATNSSVSFWAHFLFQEILRRISKRLISYFNIHMFKDIEDTASCVSLEFAHT